MNVISCPLWVYKTRLNSSVWYVRLHRFSKENLEKYKYKIERRELQIRNFLISQPWRPWRIRSCPALSRPWTRAAEASQRRRRGRRWGAGSSYPTPAWKRRLTCNIPNKFFFKSVEFSENPLVNIYTSQPLVTNCISDNNSIRLSPHSSLSVCYMPAAYLSLYVEDCMLIIQFF